MKNACFIKFSWKILSVEFPEVENIFLQKMGHAFICPMDSQCMIAGNSLSILDTFLMDSKKHSRNLQCMEVHD